MPRSRQWVATWVGIVMWVAPSCSFAQTAQDTIPSGPLGEAIRLGEQIVTHTPQTVPQYSGNALNCTSCHLDAGRKPYASPWVGIWGVFPEYRNRNARVNLMEDRINDCF